MITSFRIKNFRGFQDLTIQPLKRVNLIGGKNNTGKTALLEALLLHNGPTNPQLSVEIHRFRGIESPLAAIEDVCRWLFHEGNPSSPIEAARAAFSEKRESEFAFHRLERDQSGNVMAVTMSYKAVETALELGWEVR